jgi:hypothetical protein
MPVREWLQERQMHDGRFEVLVDRNANTEETHCSPLSLSSRWIAQLSA